MKNDFGEPEVIVYPTRNPPTRSQASRVAESANKHRQAADAGTTRWSTEIAARYRCELSPELVDWFDKEIWNQSGTSEYRQPIHPNALLTDAPEAIWPALMPCDLLPISGNTAGDWLCLRIDADNSVSEVVQWYHGGGDWIPWGRSLSEAIVFDALSVRLPGPSRRHSVPAENPRLESGQPSRRDGASSRPSSDPLLSWAADRVAPEVASLLDSDSSGAVIANTLLQHNVAEVAVRCEAVLDALHHGLTPILDRQLAANWNIPWEEMAQWALDVRCIPGDRRAQIEAHTGCEIADDQDWPAAQEHCQKVTEVSPRLAWPWDVLGYASERDAKIDAAVAAYLCASRCSVFTDQSVRLRTHWTTGRAAKFSVARLMEIRPEVVAQDDYLKRLGVGDVQRRRQTACEYWRELAERSRQNDNFSEAYQHEMAAGWDLGAEPMMTFGQLLDAIVDAAEKAGQRARAEVARAHRACLSSRYQI